MKKIMNKAEHFVDEMIEGILASHPDELTTVAGDLRRTTMQYPRQFVHRTAAVLLAFCLIFGLLPGFAAAQDLSTHEAHTALVTGQFRDDDVASNGKFAASKSLVRTTPAGAIVPIDGPVLAGKPVTFRLSGNPSNPHWVLGDGATADGSSVTHTYQKPGIYRVVTATKDESYPVPRIYELSSAIVRVHTQETLHLPQVLLDTDAHNEVDDQHYIAYALFSELDVLGINSVHHTRWTENWTNETRTSYIGSETQNYNEILNILDLMKRSGLPDERVPSVFRGAREPLKNMNIDVNRWFDTNPIVTEASEAILAAARGASPDNPVWVLPVGPATNIASAILQVRQEGWETEFHKRIRVCWLGGGPRSLISNTFNGGNDPWSVYVTVQSGIEFLMILENPTGSSFKFDKTVEGHLYPDNPLGDYLKKITPARPKNLYDITVLSMIIGSHLGEHWLTRVEPSIILGRDQGYEYRSTTEPTNLHIVWAVDGAAMKKDFFNTLNGKPTALTPTRQKR